METDNVPQNINPTEGSDPNELRWFAIKTKKDFQAENVLEPLCDEVFFPKEKVRIPGGKSRVKAFIPHVLFIKTTREKALELEKMGREMAGLPIPFWIYRYPKDNNIQIIPQKSIDFLRLITSDNSEKCEIFAKESFKKNDHVRVIDGIFKGNEGYVQRVKKNLHVVVEIEGICMVMLPFIHPDLLEKID